MNAVEKERVQAQYKRALYLSLYGSPASLPDDQKAHIKKLLKSWMFPSISSFTVNFRDIVKAHPVSSLMAGIFLFPFRAPYYFSKAIFKAQNSALTQTVEAPKVRRFTHIEVPPILMDYPPSPKKLGVIQATPESSPVRYGRIGLG